MRTPASTPTSTRTRMCEVTRAVPRVRTQPIYRRPAGWRARDPSQVKDRREAQGESMSELSGVELAAPCVTHGAHREVLQVEVLSERSSKNSAFLDGGVPGVLAPHPTPTQTTRMGRYPGPAKELTCSTAATTGLMLAEWSGTMLFVKTSAPATRSLRPISVTRRDVSVGQRIS